MSANQHNLDITNYTLKELLELYDLPKQPTRQDMQRAKKKMLMMHPDKSKLSPVYFTFYKKAFDIVAIYYHDINKQSQPMTEEATTYQAPIYENQQQIAKTVQKQQESGQFNNQFNQLFEEKGGINKQREERLKQQFGWFQQDDKESPYKQQQVNSASGINAAFESLRPQVQSIVVHRDYIPVTCATGVSYVDDEEEDESISNNYIASDMFSKLKFDDIRRVHKDQTVLPVGDSDYDKVTTYNSVEEYKKARSSQNLSALEKAKAEQIMQQQEAQRRNEYENRWSRMQKQTQQNEENNAQVLASFLLLGNSSTPSAEPARRSTTGSSSASYVNRSRSSCMR
jgi:hypothetical protein